MKKILFVCTGNYYRSRFAEEYFRHLTKIFKLNIQTSSAGFEIELADGAADRFGEIFPLTKFKLKSLGIYKEHPIMETCKPRVKITEKHFEDNDIIVILDRDEHQKYLDKYSVNYNKLLFWNVKDVEFGGTPSQVFLQIQGNCEDLISKYWLNEELWNENL